MKYKGWDISVPQRTVWNEKSGDSFLSISLKEAKKAIDKIEGKKIKK